MKTDAVTNVVRMVATIDMKILALILVLSLINPLQYALLYIFPPAEGMIFSGFGDDDALILTSIKYVDFGFRGPWVQPSDNIDPNVFLNPAAGPLYTTQMLMPFYLLGADPLALFVAFKFVSSAIMLFAVYFLFAALTENKRTRDLAFLIFSVSAGLGGILYLVYSAITGASLTYPTTLFGFGVGAFRYFGAYQSLAFTVSCLSILAYLKRKYAVSGIFMVLGVLFYPAHAIGALLAILLYTIINGTGKLNFMKVLILFMVGSIPWAAAYKLQPLFFMNYANIVQSVNVNILASILMGFGLPILFVLWNGTKAMENWGSFGANKILWVLFCIVSILLISLSEVSQSLWVRYGALQESASGFSAILGFVNSWSFAFDAMFFVFSFLVLWELYRNRSKISKTYVFLASWFVIMLMVIAFPVKINALIQGKIVLVVALPVALLGAYGTERFSQLKNIDIKKLALAIFLLSLPSLLLFYSFEQSFARDVYSEDGSLKNEAFYIKQSDMDAMKFLKTQEPGLVVSTGEAGVWLPYYSGKNAMLFGTNRTDPLIGLEEKNSDVFDFYTGDSEARTSITEKYGIVYAFYGVMESQKYPNMLESDNGFEKIYEAEGAKIYKLKRP